MVTPPNICDRLDDFGHPVRVYVVGCGINGKPFLDKLPTDAFTIAVNSLAAHPRAWSIHIVCDRRSVKRPWWKRAIPDGTKTCHLFDLVDKGRRTDYQFVHGFKLRVNDNPIQVGCLPGGATIIGCALCLAYFLDPERITLVGCDLYGKAHWDGQVASFNHRAGRWWEADRIQWLINNIMARGVTVDSLSKTILQVPVVKA